MLCFKLRSASLCVAAQLVLQQCSSWGGNHIDYFHVLHAALLAVLHSCRSDAADAATAEKQISLLTRGLSHCPSSPALLLALLRAYAAVAPDAAALAEKWRGVLARQGGSWLLWREFLAQQ